MTAPRRAATRWFVAAGALAFALFVALGTWQLQRLAWKLDLIARVTARVDAAPVPAPGPADWPRIDAADPLRAQRADHEYRRVEIHGRFDHGREALVQASTVLGPGFWVLTPLTTGEGWTVLVNRGFVDAAHRDPASRGQDGGARDGRGETAAAEASVVGLLRLSEPGGGFLRDNDPAADRWYSRDVTAIARARGLADVAPYFIDAFPPGGTAADGPAGRRWPVPGLTVIRFRNDHLVYALTWYALALMVAGAGWYARRLSRRPETR